MADVTGIPVPTNASPFAVPSDMQAIADAVGGQDRYSVSTAASLPSSDNWLGRVLMTEDTGRSYKCTALPSTWVADVQDWVAWTPTMSGGTVGNGTMVANYQKVGKRVEFTIEFTWGSTSTVTGTVAFTLPVAPAVSMSMHIGQGLFSDSSAGVSFPVDTRVAGGGVASASLIDHSVGTYSRPQNLGSAAGSPANGDTLYLAGSYRVA